MDPNPDHDPVDLPDPSHLLDLLEAVLGRRPGRLEVLGQGTDHVAYEVDGALVARVALDEATPRSVDQEAALLALVATASPVPVPVVVGVDPAAGLLVTTRLPGTSLLDAPCPDPVRLADPLAELFAALGAVAPEDAAAVVDVDDSPLAVWLGEARATLPALAGALGAGRSRVVERFLERPAPPPAGPGGLVLCHLDLGAEHLLTAEADRCTLTGIIDWSDAAIADPAVDLGRLWRDLGVEVARTIADRTGHDEAVLRRAHVHACCALLEDLHHGLATGDDRYTRAALSAFDRTFREAAT